MSERIIWSSLDESVKFLATILTDEFDVLVSLEELDMAPADPVALVGVGLATTRSLLGLWTARNLVVLMEALVTILHLDMVGLAGRLVDVRVGNTRAQALQFDLLREPACAAHDRSEEARVANLPQFECEVDG